ncbi:DUF883 domain-containing protein [Catenovulum sediminis]|uniref:DUF883 domain-containing protein n=1 Tax=Catenovulum sediminis TaxID=1740262 RepID=A0ABV1RKR6_9ALTE
MANTNTATAAKKVANSANSVTESSTPIADKVSESLHHSADSISEQAAKTEEKVRATAAQSAETMHEKQAQAKDMWQSSALKNYVDNNPVATAGIAFAAGALLSSILIKKK